MGLVGGLHGNDFVTEQADAPHPVVLHHELDVGGALVHDVRPGQGELIAGQRPVLASDGVEQGVACVPRR